IGWRHKRIRGQEHDEFVELFVEALNRQLPGVLLQWEDFALPNARPLLDRYRDRICSFNDDIQGTGAVVLGTLSAAANVTRSRLTDQRVVIRGGGSAGTGIGETIVGGMVAEGLSVVEARARVWLVDRHGLVHDGLPGLSEVQRQYARPAESVSGWQRDSAGA